MARVLDARLDRNRDWSPRIRAGSPGIFGGLAPQPLLRRTWAEAGHPLLRDLIFGIRDGILRKFDCTLSGVDTR